MSNDRLKTFTDRREAIALFDELRSRNPTRPWPLLPILAFIAPGGSGKSTLIEYLRATKCSLPGGRAAIPYASLDFTLTDTPRDLLSILINLRDQLQRHADGDGKHLLFPRFDLGALVAQSAVTNLNASPPGPTEVRQRLADGKQFIESLNTLSGALGSAIPFVPALLAGLNLAGQIKPVKDWLSYLEDNKGWQWYRTNGTRFGIGANATLKDVLLRLQTLSIPGRQDRDWLVNEALPIAFVADLLGSLSGSASPLCWTKTANVIIFLDGFEDLLNSPGTGSTAIRLLEGLTLSEHRERGETDPLLIVLGSRQLPLELTGINQEPPADINATRDDRAANAFARNYHHGWQKRLPADKNYLELKDLLLPLELHDFGLLDTRNYLSGITVQGRQPLADQQLADELYRVTQGHPLSLALATAALLAARAHGRNPTPHELFSELVPRKAVSGHERERIDIYLLDVFMKQLSEAERDEMIVCAAPRFLDAAVLQAIIPLSGSREREKRRDRYRHLTFVRAIDQQRFVFHPLVRQLLLQQLHPSEEQTSDYYRTHLRLCTYFHTLAAGQAISSADSMQAWQYQVEEAYHALALGDPQPAIDCGITAQQSNLAAWEPLLEAVAQAPAELIPGDTEQQADNAIVLAERNSGTRDGVEAIILYIWLITAYQRDQTRMAGLQNNLGEAYRNLPGGDRQANLERAIVCYEAALQVNMREAYPANWAMTQNNLGNAYSQLPGGDRQANLERAIGYYETTLQVYTQEAYPADWAMTQNNLGEAYRNLPGGDRQANLEKAIVCYEAALQVRTREAYPADWATTQNNLGIVYSGLPGGDRQANLERAIACFEVALQICSVMHLDHLAQVISGNLEIVRDKLQGLQ